MKHEFTVYAIGLCYASVCTNLSLEQATKRLNAEHPSGTTQKWQKSKDPTFHDGSPNPCNCEQGTGKKHWLFDC